MTTSYQKIQIKIKIKVSFLNMFFNNYKHNKIKYKTILNYITMKKLHKKTF